jgi:hypothetical protein
MTEPKNIAVEIIQGQLRASQRKVTELTEKLVAAEAVAQDQFMIVVETGRNEYRERLLEQENVNEELFAKERQAGRDEVLKELSEQEPVAWHDPKHPNYPIGGSDITDHGKTTCQPCIIRPEAPKEEA